MMVVVMMSVMMACVIKVWCCAGTSSAVVHRRAVEVTGVVLSLGDIFGESYDLSNSVLWILSGKVKGDG